MRTQNIYHYLILALSMLVFASCGGGASLINAPLYVAADSEFTCGEVTTDSSFTGLPSIPLDIGEPDKSSSAIGDLGTIELLGSGYLQMDGGTLDGDSLVLDPATSGNLGKNGQPVAYAVYKVSGLLGKRALSLNIECIPGGLGEGYFVGVADYSDAHWRWFGKAMFPEFEVDLRSVHNQLITHIGNMYFIIIVPEGNTATHSKTTLTYGEPDPAGRPGFPHHLVASDGKFPEAVGLNWVAGGGAATYEVFRKRLRNGDEWNKLGETSETHFADTNVPDYIMFAYRVRSVNPGGESNWSNMDTGFAGGGEDPVVIHTNITSMQSEPLAGIAVGLVGMGEEMKRHTNADGNVSFRDLPHGSYIVAPRHPELDFFPPYQVVDMSVETHEQIHFNAAPSAAFNKVWGFAVTINPECPEGRMVPLAGVDIAANPIGDPETVYATVTDENGFYMLEDLPEAIYILGAEAEGYSFLPPFHELVVNGSNRPDRADFLAIPEGGGGAGEE